MSTCEILEQACVADLDLNPIQTVVEQILRDHKINQPISCILTTDSYIQELNKMYRNIDKATDVLSFELEDPIHPDTSYLGEIYISVERAQQQARDHNRTIQAEVTHLAIHGTLHILGYEHDTEYGYQAMVKEEKKYLENQ